MTARPCRRAAFTLVVLAPAAAELTLGTVRITMIWLVLLYVPIYGAGVLFLRELARRTGGGWSNLVLLGLVYGLVEEGLALQSLTSPHLYHAADWGPRPLGINLPYAELNLPYHVLFSVIIPIALVELLFRGHGPAPYLKRGGLAITGVVALLGVLLLRVSVPPSQDKGYVMSGRALLVVAGLALVLFVLGLALRPLRVRPLPAPEPLRVALTCGFAVLLYLGLLYPMHGVKHPLGLHGALVWLPMAAAALIGLAAATLAVRWSAGPGWTQRHALAAITGALAAHTLFGLVANVHTVQDGAFLAALGVAMTALLIRFGRRLPAQDAATGVRRPDSDRSSRP